MNGAFRRRLWAPGLALAMGAVACDGFGPTWTVDLFVPIRYPDVQLADYAVGGQIPPVDLTFTSPPDSQDLEGLMDEILSGDLVAVTADVLFATQTNVTGQIEVSVAPQQADLFGADPQRALTVLVPVAATAGDTIAATVPTSLVQQDDGQPVARLYFQTRGTLRGGGGGGTTVDADDVLSLGVNLILTVTVNDSTP